MVRFEPRRPLRALGMMLLIVTVGVSREGTTQTALGDDAEDALTQISERLVEAQARGGAYAPELIDPLTRLSLLYVEDGQHALAVAAIDQTLQVVRANYGLHSLEQAPLLRQRIISEESRGNFSEAWQLEQELLALARRHPDDLRTAPILHEIGDKRMELMRSHLAAERPPQVVLGCYYEWPSSSPEGTRNCHGGSREGAARQILLEAQRNYAGAIGVLYRQQLYASDELHALENKLLRNSYASRNYHVGRRSLVRLVSYDTANSEPLLARIERLVELADWDLVFAQKTLALDLYAETYAFLRREGLPQAKIDEIFSPELPVVVPTFLPNRFAPELAEGATGYVDVTFDITRFGTTRRIRVLDTSGNVSNAAQGRATRWIVENHFRPRVIDGHLADASRVVARHYVHE